MNALSIALLLMLQTVANLKISIPSYPLMAFHGGTVVAVIEGKLKSGVSILHAEEPFLEPVQEALKQWSFAGKDSNRDVLVVVNFRDFVVPLSRVIDCPQPKRHLPVPAWVTDPVYPENPLLLEGAVVVRMKISAAGSVQKVDVIKGIGGFNPCVTEAVTQWKFKPARDRYGRAMESEAFAVCVWRPLQNRSGYE
jgi:hypothetical protein